MAFIVFAIGLSFYVLGDAMSRVKQCARVGAAAFALGLSLAGPQALGVASADSGESDASAAVSAQGKPADAAARGVGREARAGRIARAAGVAGSSAPAASAAPDDGVGAGPVVRGPRAAAARPATRAVRGPRIAAAARPAAGAASGSETTTLTSASSPAATVRAVAAATGAAVAAGAGSAVTPTPLAAATQRPAWVQAISNAVAYVQEQQARPVVANPVGSIQAALHSGTDTAFHTLNQLLSNLPANPISDFLSGALLLVRRTLFDEVQTPYTFTNVLEANGQWSGSLNTVDPWDEKLTSTITAAPAHGSVQINTDGTYTYTPDEGYIGTDSFTVSVNDPGFDLFNPLASRVQSVTATVDTSIATPDANNFIYPSIKNQGCLPDSCGAVVACGTGACLSSGETFKVDWSYYRIGQTGAEQFADGGPRLKQGDTWFLTFADPQTGAPAPGKYFMYKTYVVREIYGKPDRPLIEITWTQDEGHKVTTARDDKLQYWGKEYSSEPWAWTLRFLTLKGPINATQQVQLSIPV